MCTYVCVPDADEEVEVKQGGEGRRVLDLYASHHTHHVQVIRNLFPKFSKKFVWKTVEEFTELKFSDILQAIADEAEEAAKTVTATTCGAGRSRSTTLVQHMAAVQKMALLVKRAKNDEPGSLHRVYTEMEERRKGVGNLRLPLGSPWMDDVRLALHYAMLRGGHTATGQAGFLLPDRNNRSGIQTTASCSDVCVIVSIVNHLFRFFGVLRCAYAGMSWKSGKQHCLPAPSRRGAEAPLSRTKEQMKLEGRHTALLPHLRKMFRTSGFAAVRGSSEDLPEVLRNIRATDLPTEDSILMGQVGACGQSIIIPPLHAFSKLN